MNIRLTFEDNKFIDSPWISSVQIGKQFDQSISSESIKTKAQFVIGKDEKSITFHSLAIWNINSQFNIDPSSERLLLEYTTTGNPIDSERKDVNSVFVTTVSFTLQSKCTIVVDQNPFQNVVSGSVSPMLDPRDQCPMGIYFNIFTPYR